MRELTVAEWKQEIQWARDNGHADYEQQIVDEVFGGENPVAAPEPAAAAAPEQQTAPQDDGFSFDEMVSNIPSSAAGVAGDFYNAITNPIDTAAGLGQAVLGGLQHAREALPEALAGAAPRALSGPARKLGQTLQNTAPFALPAAASALGHDFRPQGSAVADFYADRYGGVDNALNTLEQDPVGAGLDAMGLLGTAAPRTAARINPITRGLGGGMERLAESTMSSATKLPKTLTSRESSQMIRGMLDQGVNPSPRGVAKLEKIIDMQGRKVDDMIAIAKQGDPVPVRQVLDHLDELRAERGGSLVDGGESLQAIDDIAIGIELNAQRLGKTTLDAKDLQKLKRDLYNTIAWNAKRQTAEVPVAEDTRKAVARGARREIERMVPEIAGANRRLGDNLELKPHLERASRRIEDRDLFGMGDAIAAGTGGAVGYMTGSPILGSAIWGMQSLFNNPKISPNVAQGLWRAGGALNTPSGNAASVAGPLVGREYYAAERGLLEEDEDG
jgi:hypothetical protein